MWRSKRSRINRLCIYSSVALHFCLQRMDPSHLMTPRRSSTRRPLALRGIQLTSTSHSLLGAHQYSLPERQFHYLLVVFGYELHYRTYRTSSFHHPTKQEITSLHPPYWNWHDLLLIITVCYLMSASLQNHICVLKILYTFSPICQCSLLLTPNYDKNIFSRVNMHIRIVKPPLSLSLSIPPFFVVQAFLPETCQRCLKQAKKSNPNCYFWKNVFFWIRYFSTVYLTGSLKQSRSSWNPISIWLNHQNTSLFKHVVKLACHSYCSRK